MTIVVKEVGKNPTPKNISDDVFSCLKDLQGIVGGYIQEIDYPTENDNGVVLICREKGKLQRLTPNIFCGRDVIVGDICFVNTKLNKEGEKEYVSLTKPQMNFLLKKFNSARS